MKLLVLGGTRFLGRHFVDAALGADHDVTIFTRGASESPWLKWPVTHLVGDRDPLKGQGLAALETGEWDAAIDLSGYVPRCVEASAKLLATRVGHYAFVSSMSVYADSSRPNLDETTPVAKLEDPASEDIMAHYGALKAACEDQVRTAFPNRALIVRPGLIVGPHDPTDRFAYWVARFLLPERLGDRPREAVVPAPPSRPVQFIDARDLATWMLAAMLARTPGTFNADSAPRMWTMGSLVDTLVERRTSSEAPPVTPRWIDEAKLIEQRVTPWTELPLWIPATDVASAGFMEFSSARAFAQGLRIRPLWQTIDDTATWLAKRAPDYTWRNVLSADKERALLAAA
jgi:2'-hydroxyisoflavone reductase